MHIHYILLILASGCLLSLAISWFFLQIFLAKYKPDSVLYWRKCTWLTRICFFLTSNRAVAAVAIALRVIVTVDLSLWQWIKMLKYMPAVIKIKIIFDEIDDTADTAKPADLLMRGQVFLGSEISPFLNNIMQEKHVRVFNQLLQKNIMPRNELISFGNLLAYKLHKQAMLTLQFNDTTEACDRARIRTRIAQENLEIGGSYLALLIHLVKKDVRIAQLLDRQENLTYEHLKDIYPKASKSGELFQISHDAIDFRLDLKEERSIQKISGNYFLAQLQQYGVLPWQVNELYALSDRVVGFHELPENVRMVFVQVQRQFVDSVFQMGFLQGLVLCLDWEYKWRAGFRV